MESYDVVIFGGGIIGVTCGIGLTRDGVSVLLVEKREEILQKNSERCFALAKRSQDILQNFGVWDENWENAKIEHIMIYDEGSASQVHYDRATVGVGPMGFVVAANALEAALAHNVHFEVQCAEECMNICFRDGKAEVVLKNGREIQASIIVCADGKNSTMRQRLGIKKFIYNFDQSCLVCNVEHEKNHNKTAIEHFYKNGPFAMLPMNGGYKTSIVWTEKTELAKALNKLKKSEFTAALQEKCYYHLGKIVLKSNVVCFPISMILAKNQVFKNVVLLGDASHSIHPIAGQGLNVGLRDVYALVEIIKKYQETGADLGKIFILREIQDSRALDNSLMAGMTTLLNNIFSSDSLVLKCARRTVMTAVEASPTIKKMLISHAMGIGKICE